MLNGSTPIFLKCRSINNNPQPSGKESLKTPGNPRKTFSLSIWIPDFSVNLKGELDLQGFLALNKNTRPGFQSISGTVDIKSSSSKTEIDKLIDTVNTHCPVLDILSKGVPIKLFQKVTQSAFVNKEQTEQRASVA